MNFSVHLANAVRVETFAKEKARLNTSVRDGLHL